jgi:Ca2+/Na+ antiporter
LSSQMELKHREKEASENQTYECRNCGVTFPILEAVKYRNRCRMMMVVVVIMMMMMMMMMVVVVVVVVVMVVMAILMVLPSAAKACTASDPWCFMSHGRAHLFCCPNCCQEPSHTDCGHSYLTPKGSEAGAERIQVKAPQMMLTVMVMVGEGG